MDFTFGSKFVLFLKVVYKVLCIAMASLSLSKRCLQTKCLRSAPSLLATLVFFQQIVLLSLSEAGLVLELTL